MKAVALSKEMQFAVEAMKAHGRKMYRSPGGFWMAYTQGDTRLASDNGRIFGTLTVEALVKRGIAEYTDWRDGRNGRFPIEATLTLEARDETH
jgi:hypothetical protein